MSYAQVVLGLIVLIMLHEAGHFLVARWVGIRATKFYLFFPPALFRWKRGDVEYGIGAIPLGGFVKLPGMFEPTGGEVDYRLEPSVEHLLERLDDQEQEMRVRSAFNKIKNAANADELGEALAQFDLELLTIENRENRESHMLTKRLRIRVESCIDDCHPNAYWRARLWRRMATIFAGPLVNLVIAFVVLWSSLIVHHPQDPQTGFYVAAVVKHSPAQDAGIKVGDTIERWNGANMQKIKGDLDAKEKVVKDGKGNPLDVVVMRKGHGPKSFHLVPERLQKNDKEKLVGVQLGLQTLPGSFGYASPVTAAKETMNIFNGATRATVRGLIRLSTEKGRKEVSSVVGIVDNSPSQAEVIGIFAYIAFISLALAIMNLLPIMPLDGGHLFFGLIEFLRRGRPLPKMVFERASFVGLTLILMLFAVGLRNDLGLS